MGIVYRHEKKEPLTITEMDGNFAFLDQRLRELETNPALGEGIAKIAQEGDQLTFHGTFGSFLGKVVIPKVFPSYQGKWQEHTSYRVQDWVQMNRRLYSCMEAHISKEFESDKGFWVLVFEL